jgi:hypothetical protein
MKLSIILYIYIYIYIYKWKKYFKYLSNTYINNVTTLFSCKRNSKTTMPHKLIWMDEMFMLVTSSCDCHCDLVPLIVPHIVFCD